MQDEALYKCRLLLFEDPALEAQPRHEVAVVWGEMSQWPTIPSDPALVSPVYIALKTWIERLYNMDFVGECSDGQVGLPLLLSISCSFTNSQVGTRGLEMLLSMLYVVWRNHHNIMDHI